MKQRRGDPPDILQRRVELLPLAARIYSAFFEIDRNEVGHLVFASMLAVLDEYGWEEKHERLEIRAIWKAMSVEERRIWKERHERERAGGKKHEEVDE